MSTLLVLCACSAVSHQGMRCAHLAAPGADAQVAAIADAFAARNPGYALHWSPAVEVLDAAARARVVLLQSGTAAVAVQRAGADAWAGQATIGDVFVLRPQETIRFAAPVGLLVFTVPEEPPGSVPAAIRPDWDPRITDTPGGCATDDKAYRRVLLTWLDKNGPYTFHGLNVHRVRIDDSFTHYHPAVGGFDEFYLVQAARPGACILTSERTADILRPEAVTRADVPDLLQRTGLAAGDLVYLPRGTAHRGLGGVLAQVVTAPGFVPGAEIGLDFHLRQINERLGLTGDAALPLHAAAADRQVVR